jgi:hypothetical protein
MAEISLDDLYAVVGRLYVLHLVEQRDHNATRQRLAEAQRATEPPADPVAIGAARPQRKGG